MQRHAGRPLVQHAVGQIAIEQRVVIEGESAHPPGTRSSAGDRPFSPRVWIASIDRISDPDTVLVNGEARPTSLWIVSLSGWSVR